MTKKWKSFAQARKFVITLGLKNVREWERYCKSGKKPADIPSNPQRQYKEEWKKIPVGERWGYWLGTGTINAKDKKFKVFKKARIFVHSLKLKSKQAWEKYCESGEKPNDIPVKPSDTYKNKGWKGWPDWLGTKRLSTKNIRPFVQARKFARSLELNSEAEWKKYCESGEKPNDIPVKPSDTYKNKGWKSMPDWLGNDNVATQQQSQNYLTGKEAKILGRKVKKEIFGDKKITTKDWEDAHKAGKIPKELPRYFHNTWKIKNMGKNEKSKS